MGIKNPEEFSLQRDGGGMFLAYIFFFICCGCYGSGLESEEILYYGSTCFWPIIGLGGYTV